MDCDSVLTFIYEHICNGTNSKSNIIRCDDVKMLAREYINIKIFYIVQVFTCYYINMIKIEHNNIIKCEGVIF